MRKHLLLITTSFPESRNGQEAAGSFVSDFALELSNHVNVTVVCPGSQESSHSEDGIQVERFKAPNQALSTLKPSKLIDAIQILKVLYAGRKKCLSVCETSKIDHIFALWVLPSGYWAKQCSQRFNIPYSTWALGSDIWSLGKLPVVKSILSSVLKNAHSNFADGLKLCEDVKSLHPGDCGFLASTRKNVPAPQKSGEITKHKLGFLGRWHTNKGADIFLDALGLLNDEDWEKISEVHFAGGGPLESTVKSNIKKLGEKNRNVRLYGYLDKKQAAKFIHHVDWLVIPSRIESIPVIFSDAISASTPIICTPVGDLPSLVDEYKFGIVASEASSGQIAASIKSALSLQPSQFTTNLNQLESKFKIENIACDLIKQLNLLEEEF